jgi:hypothetical protein
MKLRCSQTCNKIATAFGQFCGGVCDTHAVEGLQSGDYKLEMFWEEHRERLAKLLEEVFPFKPGDWVVDFGERVARVKGVSRFAGDVYLDLYMYSDRGDNLGRTSPAMGGPRAYEPCCSAEGWTRLEREPDWPIKVKGIPTGDGKVVLQKWAGTRNPKPANYVPRKRRGGGSFRLPADDSKLRQALQDIANGHNDARRRAKDALGLP